LEPQVTEQSEQPIKKHDVVEYTLLFSFVMVLSLICFMSFQGREVPETLIIIFGGLGTATGLYKAQPFK